MLLAKRLPPSTVKTSMRPTKRAAPENFRPTRSLAFISRHPNRPGGASRTPNRSGFPKYSGQGLMDQPPARIERTVVDPERAHFRFLGALAIVAAIALWVPSIGS